MSGNKQCVILCPYFFFGFPLNAVFFFPGGDEFREIRTEFYNMGHSSEARLVVVGVTHLPWCFCCFASQALSFLFTFFVS